MAKKIAKVFILLVMLTGLVFSAINFVAPHQVSALSEANGHDVAGLDGNAYDCAPGGAQCMIVTAPPVN